MTQSLQIPDSRIIWPPEHSPTSSMVFAQNTIEIAATPGTVWSLLIDCVKWPSWLDVSAHKQLTVNKTKKAKIKDFITITTSNYLTR
jgi:hypothetical protein